MRDGIPVKLIGKLLESLGFSDCCSIFPDTDDPGIIHGFVSRARSVLSNTELTN